MSRSIVFNRTVLFRENKQDHDSETDHNRISSHHASPTGWNSSHSGGEIPEDEDSLILRALFDPMVKYQWRVV